jgi:hypothetical protein
MSNLSQSPKLRLQLALFDLISYCETEDQYGIKEIWLELNQMEQEQIWSFLSTAQKTYMREALRAEDNDEPPPF